MSDSTNPGKLIGKGRTADVFALDEWRILKLYQNWMPASEVEKEFQVTLSAYNAGISVPQPFEFMQQEDRFGIISERIIGTSLMQELQRHPQNVAGIARQLADLHVMINQTPAPIGLPGQFDQIIYKIHRTDALSDHEKEQIIAHLKALPEGNCLCHGDFHPDNVLITEKGPVIIDWLTGTSGSAAGDFFRTVMIMTTSAMPAGIPRVKAVVLDLFRSLLVRNYQKQYLQELPIKSDELTRWKLPILAARLMEVEDYPAEKENILKQIHLLM
jgi:aminoglycoside phosphotransferase (APT) family kinase protein